ncbi:hypothetical protein [Ramlibacter sp.]|uniref:hypothetical protein n=1 Tax=Ramlibacter sp. TaxID=1917967 RepID=UPI002621D974|nr:hypothetical protein [Ramlibacter sp.]MDB5957215.1 hypothetical protein [Ramlibacter sp.]
MSGGSPNQEQRPREHPQPHEDGKRSGEGSNTALEALIRQRKMAEGPEPSDPVPPG